MELANGTSVQLVREAVQEIIESKRFEWAITGLIIINAIIMGMETNPQIQLQMGGLLHSLDQALLLIFTLELTLRVFVYRKQFFTDPWSIFDTTIIAIAWMPATGGLSVLRALRILRVLRLISVVPSLRKVVGGLIGALPGMGSIVMLLLLVFYIFAGMGTTVFAQQFPVFFGSLSKSAYTLFQIMTLESWSMGVVRPIMEQFPYAWIYFVLFIVCTTFTVLNLFVGIIVSAMSAEGEELAIIDRQNLKNDQDKILVELRALREEIAELKLPTTAKQ